MSTKRNSTSKKSTTNTNSLLNQNKNQNTIRAKGTTAGLSKFTQENLKEYNKTDQEKQMESVEDFRLNAIIETESVIGSLNTNVIPLLELDLKKAERTLESAEKSYEKCRYSTAYTYQDYLEARKYALSSIKDAKNTINDINNKIEYQKAQLAMYQEILADLS